MSEQLALLIPVLALSSTLLLSTTLSTLLTVLFTVVLAAVLPAVLAALFVVFISSSVIRDSIFRFLVTTTSVVFCWLLSLSELNLAAVRVCAVG